MDKAAAFVRKSCFMLQNGKRPRWRTLKQPKGSNVCVAAVCAMIVGSELQDFIDFAGHPGDDGYSECEVAAWLASYGICISVPDQKGRRPQLGSAARPSADEV